MKEICPYDECKKVLSTPYSLKRHIDTCHNNVRKFICSSCDKKFSSQRNLWTHLAKHRVSDLTSSRKLSPSGLLLWSKVQAEASPLPFEEPTKDFLEGCAVLPAIEEGSHESAKLPLAWLLLSSVTRGRGASR